MVLSLRHIAMIIDVCTLIIILKVLVIISYVKIYLYSDFPEFQKNYVHSLKSNWNKAPIAQISIRNECHWDEESLIKFRWVGTRRGCKCGTSLINRDSCDNRNENCYHISSLNSSTFNYWRGNQLCVKRFASNYFNLIRVNRNNECVKDFKNCGFIDSLNNSLCIPMNSVCPLSDYHLGIIMNNDKKYFNKEIDSRNFTEEVIKNHSLVIEVLVNENQPCLDSRVNVSSFSKFSLINFSFNENCFNNFSSSQENFPVHDYRYRRIDNYTYNSFFKDNNILKSVTNLPDFPVKELGKSVSLYSRNYIGIKFSCLNITGKFTQKQIIEILSSFDFASKLDHSFLMVLLFFCFFLKFFLLVYLFLLNYNWNRYAFVSKEIRFNVIVYDIPLTIITNVNFALLLMNSIKAERFFGIFNENCTDFQTLISFKDLDFLKESNFYFGIGTFLMVAENILSCFNYIIIFSFGRDKENTI